MVSIEFGQPENANDFENLVLSLYQLREKRYIFAKLGRNGQAQFGIDIIGTPKVQQIDYLGVQCKRVKPNVLTESKIRAAIELSDHYERRLEKLVLATTLQRDAKLQSIEQRINDERRIAEKHLLEFVFWNDICDWLNETESLQIAQRFYPRSFSSLVKSWNISKVSLLKNVDFALGDRNAAEFQYVTQPISSEWEEANKFAQEIINSSSYGTCLITGLANSGKTRLAFELIRSNFPEWDIVRVESFELKDEIFPLDSITDHNLVVFIDDLQKFVSSKKADTIDNIDSQHVHYSFQASKAEMLLASIRRFQSIASRSAIIATYRKEDEISVQAELGTLFSNSKVINIPSFPIDFTRSDVRSLMDSFSEHGNISSTEWDGTIGSLLLGFVKKRQQYALWVNNNHYAAFVLHAMKLLEIAKTPRHTYSRIQAICASLFDKSRLKSSRFEWQSTIDTLVMHGFILNPTPGEEVLRIAKDDFFTQVIQDYPPLANEARQEIELYAYKNLFVQEKDAEVLSNLGVYRYDHGEFEEAIICCDQALLIDPELWSAYNNRGNALHALGRNEEALIAYNEALKLNPKSATAWSNKAAVLGDKLSFSDSLFAAEQSIKLDSTNAAPYVNKAASEAGLGDREAAIKSLLKAVQLDPKLIMAWHNLSVVYYEANQIKDAIEACEKAIALDTAFESGWVNYVIFKSICGEITEAERSIDKISGSRNKAIAWFNIAVILHEKMQNHQQALTAVNNALQYDNNLVEALALKGALLCLFEDYEEATRYCSKAIKLDSSSFAAWMNIGIVYQKLGEREGVISCFSRAEDFFSTAISLNSNNAFVRAERGRVRARQGKLLAAIEDFKEALKLNPDLESAKINLRTAESKIAENRNEV